jgi:hypothetical protein
MKNPKIIKQYVSEDNVFLIKAFKTTSNEIVIETSEYVDGKNVIKQFSISKQTAISFAQDMLKKANELK